jgi:hypothetical protein
MSISISLKLQELIYKDTETIIKKNKIPRNSYINNAMKYYNAYNKRMLMRDKLRTESDKVATDSIKILNEYEKIESNLGR